MCFKGWVPNNGCRKKAEQFREELRKAAPAKA